MKLSARLRPVDRGTRLKDNAIAFAPRPHMFSHSGTEPFSSSSSPRKTFEPAQAQQSRFGQSAIGSEAICRAIVKRRRASVAHRANAFEFWVQNCAIWYDSDGNGTVDTNETWVDF